MRSGPITALPRPPVREPTKFPVAFHETANREEPPGSDVARRKLLELLRIDPVADSIPSVVSNGSSISRIVAQDGRSLARLDLQQPVLVVLLKVTAVQLSDTVNTTPTRATIKVAFRGLNPWTTPVASLI